MRNEREKTQLRNERGNIPLVKLAREGAVKKQAIENAIKNAREKM